MTKAEAVLIAIFRAVKPKDVSDLEIRVDQIRFTGPESRRWRVGLLSNANAESVMVEEVSGGMLISHQEAQSLDKKIEKHLRAIQDLARRI